MLSKAEETLLGWRTGLGIFGLARQAMGTTQCIRSGRDCVWPKEDGRRRPSGTALKTVETLPSQRCASTDVSSPAPLTEESPVGWGQQQNQNTWTYAGVSCTSEQPGTHDDASDTVVFYD